MAGNVEALSEREKETLRLLLQGHDAKSIARDLGLSVHTVNERLRASRRKLEVTSSREAARLLVSSEQRTPNFVVDTQIGVAVDAVDMNKDRSRTGRKGLQHRVVLAIGGCLIMSLIIAAALLPWNFAERVAPGAWPQGGTAAIVPERGAPPRNIIRLDGNRLLWNDEELSEAVLRQYLDLTTYMNPQPLVVLSYSAQTQPERVQRIRSLIKDVIRCTPNNCLEITSPPA